MTSNKKFEVEATIRHEIGKGASRRLRHEKKVPAVIYGGGKEAVALTLEHNQLTKSLENVAFYSHILTLKTGSESERVILKDMQRHPFKRRILHVDFQRVRADEKLTMNVPLHFLGKEKAPGLKEGGLISHNETDVEISCLPDNLPEYIEIDISELQLNQTLHLSDLKLPEGIELVALAQDNDKAIVSIHLPRIEEEPIVAETLITSAEVPAIAQKSEDEGKGKDDAKK